MRLIKAYCNIKVRDTFSISSSMESDANTHASKTKVTNNLDIKNIDYTFFDKKETFVLFLMRLNNSNI